MKILAYRLYIIVHYYTNTSINMWTEGGSWKNHESPHEADKLQTNFLTINIWIHIWVSELCTFVDKEEEESFPILCFYNFHSDMQIWQNFFRDFWQFSPKKIQFRFFLCQKCTLCTRSKILKKWWRLLWTTPFDLSEKL